MSILVTPLRQLTLSNCFRYSKLYLYKLTKATLLAEEQAEGLSLRNVYCISNHNGVEAKLECTSDSSWASVC